MSIHEHPSTSPQIGPPVSDPWIVVNTHPHRERYASENLERQGFRAYCPLTWKRITRYSRTTEVIVSLFPSYLFVNIDPTIEQWRPIQSTYGVKSVICAGTRPRILDWMVVASLRAREVGGIIRRPVVSLKIDQTVTVNAGALIGLVGQIIELREKDRIVILMELLNRPVKLNVDAQSVTPA